MGSAFIPSQLYHDLQSTDKNLYVVVARELQKGGSAALLFSSSARTSWKSSSARYAASLLA